MDICKNPGPRLAALTHLNGAKNQINKWHESISFLMPDLIYTFTDLKLILNLERKLV